MYLSSFFKGAIAMVKAASSTLADAVVGTAGGDKLILQAKENNKAKANRVRDMRTLFHSTFVENPDKRYHKNWKAYEAAKIVSKEVGEAGGEEYDSLMNLVKNTYVSEDNYVEVLTILGLDEEVETFKASRVKAQRVIALKNLAHEAFVACVPQGFPKRWDVFDGARPLYRSLGEAGGADYNSILNLLKHAYTSKETYEECILALGGSIEPPAKTVAPAKAETVAA